MTTDYKQLFNNKVEEETNRQQLNNQRIDAAKADLAELHDVLVDVVEDSEMNILVEQQEDSVDFVVAHNNKELTVELDTDEVVVREKAISFTDDVESGDVVAHTDDEDDVRFVVEVVESTIVYDKEAMLHSKSEMIGYVVARVAEMVAKG
ncbi:MAG TPA: hypothetical protein DEB42_00505 [Jeotgalicoccus sp.]|nr:hypothetical protein [Jeotgalicoccus sp.]